MTEPSNLAVGGEDVGGDVAGYATHHRHAGAHAELVDVVRAVGLAEDTVNIVGEVEKLEPDVQMCECVVVRHTIVVDAGVLLCNGHHLSHDVEHTLKLDPHAIGDGGPHDCEARNVGGLPFCANISINVDRFPVEGQLEAVDIVVPLGGLLGTHVEAVVSEADAQSLDPCEVTAHGGVALADEVSVDVEVSIGEDTEVLVLLAMEVEVVAVGPREAGVTAGYTRVEVTQAVGLAAWAHDDALVGAAAVAGGDAGAGAVLGVVAGEHLLPLPESPRGDHVGVLRQWGTRLRCGRHGGAQHHQHGRRGHHSHGERPPGHCYLPELASLDDQCG
uniref:Uncharacterized protein n=1 Tax=Aegilops tauschii subsp. strangulata TaxID=200361 RepID=A0A453GV67_AEGTS